MYFYPQGHFLNISVTVTFTEPGLGCANCLSQLLTSNLFNWFVLI